VIRIPLRPVQLAFLPLSGPVHLILLKMIRPSSAPDFKAVMEIDVVD
jgi:hypothetical protein